MNGKQTTSNLRITQLRPKYQEIMLRLLGGQKQGDIAREMGMTQGRVSIIVNSPLFKLELKKRMMRREARLLEIEDGILEATQLGINLHREVLEDKKKVFPTEMKLKSATTMIGFGIKLFPNQVKDGDLNEEEGEGYEERLRKITVTERVRKMNPKTEAEGEEEDGREIDNLLSENYPDDSLITPTSEEEDDIFFYPNPAFDESFSPTPKIETILEGKDG